MNKTKSRKAPPHGPNPVNPHTNLSTEWKKEIARLKGQSPLATWLTISRLKVIFWAMKRASHGKDENLTLEKFHARVAHETGASVPTVYRWTKNVDDLMELLGPGVVEKLVAKESKIAFDTELLEKLPTVTDRETALGIVKVRESTCDGADKAMEALDDALKAQDRASIKARIAQLTTTAPANNTNTETATESEGAFRNVVLWGDAGVELRKLPNNHLQCIATSPPFFGLRNYGGELGQEPTVEAYVKNMVKICREARRVLRTDGLLWLEIGDTQIDGERMMVPHRVALALQADGWFVRDEIIWNKTTAMPEMVRNRSACVHSTIYMLSKSDDYYYDHNAVKESAVGGTHTGTGAKIAKPGSGNRNNGSFMGAIHRHSVSVRNLRSVWSEPTGKCKFAHTSTFPEWIPEKCVRASMSPHGGCARCGAPWRAKYHQTKVTNRPTGTKCKDRGHERAAGFTHSGMGVASALPPPELIGWEPTCECGVKDVVPQVGGDIFGGTGTVAAVLKRLGHDYVLIELDRAANEDAIRLRLAEVGRAKEPNVREIKRIIRECRKGKAA